MYTRKGDKKEEEEEKKDQDDTIFYIVGWTKNTKGVTDGDQ